MSLKLKTIVAEHELEHPSGYKFRVTANWDEEFGWQGAVTLTAWGRKDQEGALVSLIEAAEWFLKVAKEEVSCSTES